MKLKVPFYYGLKDYLKFLENSQMLAQTGWVFSNFRQDMVLRQTADWVHHYLPVDVHGKTVLDVGAGEGETAFFFLTHGAAKVIAIECDLEAFQLLKDNALRHPQVIPIHKMFTLNDLTAKVDFVKIDIEGYEETLLILDKMPCSSVVEIHGQQLRDKFLARGWRIPTLNRYGCVCYGYWGC